MKTIHLVFLTTLVLALPGSAFADTSIPFSLSLGDCAEEEVLRDSRTFPHKYRRNMRGTKLIYWWGETAEAQNAAVKKQMKAFQEVFEGLSSSQQNLLCRLAINGVDFNTFPEGPNTGRKYISYDPLYQEFLFQMPCLEQKSWLNQAADYVNEEAFQGSPNYTRHDLTTCWLIDENALIHYLVNLTETLSQE